MQVLNPEAVESIKLAGGASHRVRRGTLEVAGGMVLGEPTPLLAFVDDDTGEHLSVPRHAVVGFDGDHVMSEPPPPPPPPPSNPYEFDAGRGVILQFRSPVELDPEVRARAHAGLLASKNGPDQERWQLTDATARLLWIAPPDPYARQQAQRQAGGTAALQQSKTTSFADFDLVMDQVKQVMNTGRMTDHLLRLFSLANEAEPQEAS